MNQRTMGKATTAVLAIVLILVAVGGGLLWWSNAKFKSRLQTGIDEINERTPIRNFAGPTLMRARLDGTRTIVYEFLESNPLASEIDRDVYEARERERMVRYFSTMSELERQQKLRITYVGEFRDKEGDVIGIVRLPLEEVEPPSK